MAKVSVILASLRPEAAERVIASVPAAADGVDYEVVLVSRFRLPNVLNVPEGIPGGAVSASIRGFLASSGDYIIPWPDDATFAPCSIRNIMRICQDYKEPFLAGFTIKVDRKVSPRTGAFGKEYCGFCCVSRNTLDGVGGYFRPVFRGYWADVDLALRVWMCGGIVEPCRNALAFYQNVLDVLESENQKRYFDADLKAFLDIWYPIFGQGVSRERVEANWRLINKPLLLRDQLILNVQLALMKIPYLQSVKRRVFG